MCVWCCSAVVKRRWVKNIYIPHIRLKQFGFVAGVVRVNWCLWDWEQEKIEFQILRRRDNGVWWRQLRKSYLYFTLTFKKDSIRFDGLRRNRRSWKVYLTNNALSSKKCLLMLQTQEVSINVIFSSIYHSELFNCHIIYDLCHYKYLNV